MSNYQGHQNALEFYADYLKNMDIQDRFNIQLVKGEIPTGMDENPLLKDALSRSDERSRKEFGYMAINWSFSVLETIFSETENPLFAFRALKLALAAGVPVPEWCHGYMDQAITYLLRQGERGTKGKPGAILSDAFGMGKRGENYFEGYRRTINTVVIVLEVVLIRNKKKLKSWEKALHEISGTGTEIDLNTFNNWKKAIFKLL